MDSKQKLFEDESSEDERESLKINKSYAQNYERWRSKEEYQKLKDRYGDDAESEEESSTDEELAGTKNPDFDMDFFRVVAALQLKHPILNEERKFFNDEYTFERDEKETKEAKPMTVKDYEYKIMLEKRGNLEDEENYPSYSKQNTENTSPNKAKCYGFENDNLSDSTDEENDGLSSLGLFRKKVTEPEKKSNDAIAFLKGEKRSLKDPLDEILLTGLKKKWESDMSKDNKFLMDYFVNQRYLDKEDATMERAHNHFPLDIESLSEDEKTFDRLEEFETKYRFRYEEPNEQFIKSHPRLIGDSMRKRDTKRKDLREKKKAKVELEKERRKQEIRRMRALKRKEILDKIDKLKTVAGRETINFEEMDLDDDFDPEKHDATMAKYFDDDYYNEITDERDKPSIEDEELKRELEEQYDKLEALDSLTEGTYRYEKVFPNNYGLSVEEILLAKDTELNRWYSLKKMLRHERSREMETRDLKNYQNRATREDIKRKILPSLFAENIVEQLEAEEDRKRRRNLKKKERKLRKKTQSEAVPSEIVIEEPKLTKTQIKKMKKMKKISQNEEESKDEVPNMISTKENVSERNDDTSEVSTRKKEKNLKNIEVPPGGEAGPISFLKGKAAEDFNERRSTKTENDYIVKKDKLKKRSKTSLDYDPDPVNGETTASFEVFDVSRPTKRKNRTDQPPPCKRGFQKGRKSGDTVKNRRLEFSLDYIGDRRLAAYGFNPKKSRKKFKYANI